MSTTKKRVQAQALLRQLKSALQGTELWDCATLNHTNHLGPGRPLATILSAVGKARPSLDLRCFMSEWVGPKEQLPVASLVLSTFDRLAFGHGVLALADALEGASVELEVDFSWSWDHEHRQPDGSATHRTNHKLQLRPGAARPFVAAKWLKTALEHVCFSPDPRADRCVFQLERELRRVPACTAYTRTSSGYILGYDNLKKAQDSVNSMFPDCEVQFKRGDGEVHAVVTLPGALLPSTPSLPSTSRPSAHP